MRRFAGSLAYERISDGNRITMSFPLQLSGDSYRI
jgi:hypothetical protein